MSTKEKLINLTYKKLQTDVRPALFSSKHARDGEFGEALTQRHGEGTQEEYWEMSVNTSDNQYHVVLRKSSASLKSLH